MTFEQEVKKRVKENGANDLLNQHASDFMVSSIGAKYSYNFSWMGRPIIQYPQDMIAVQEIVWQVKPDLIIETGIARGGSIIFYASLLELLSLSGHGDGMIVGVDVDIRSHNRQEIKKHPMYKRVKMIQGSSIDPEIVSKVKEIAKGKQRVLVLLDSNHTHDHVEKELEAYASLVTIESYCVVFDTIVEDLPDSFYSDRPWSKGDNPKTAVYEFVDAHKEFIIDESVQEKLQITVAPSGYLKRIS